MRRRCGFKYLCLHQLAYQHAPTHPPSSSAKGRDALQTAPADAARHCYAQQHEAAVIPSWHLAPSLPPAHCATPPAPAILRSLADTQPSFFCGTPSWLAQNRSVCSPPLPPRCVQLWAAVGIPPRAEPRSRAPVPLSVVCGVTCFPPLPSFVVPTGTKAALAQTQGSPRARVLSVSFLTFPRVSLASCLSPPCCGCGDKARRVHRSWGSSLP